MLPTHPITITDTAIENLQRAAEQLQSHYQLEDGYCYGLDELMGVLVAWVEGTIEDMSSDAFYHCIEGRDDYAFNRHAFRKAMQKVHATH